MISYDYFFNPPSTSLCTNHVLFDVVQKTPGIRSYQLQPRGLVTKYDKKLFCDKKFRPKHDFFVEV